MGLKGSLARLVFTSIWASHLNHAGFRVRKVHSLTRATVWDGAEERLVRFYFTRQRVPVVGVGEVDPRPEALLDESSASEAASAQVKVDYLVTDSRSPFPTAIGETTPAGEGEPKPVRQQAYSTGMTQSPFGRAYLAD